MEDLNNWHHVPHSSTLSKDLEEWKKIWHLFPPSFFNVWVMNGKRKCKAYFNAPTRHWNLSTKNVWADPEIYQVKCWREIEDETFEMQRLESCESEKVKFNEVQ